MNAAWTILHGGALGDLVLTIQLALRMPARGPGGGLRVVSRVSLGDLHACQPPVERWSSEGMGLHWLFAEHDEPAPPRLDALVRGARVLNMLGGVDGRAHVRLARLKPATLLSVDPRPEPGVERHITEQWQTQLEAQGLLVPKCIHQRPAQRGLGVPAEWRERGRRLLAEAGGVHAAAAHASARCGAYILHPGSGGRRKCWHLDGFCAVARQLTTAGGAACFLLGPVELETWSAAQRAELAREFACLQSPDADTLLTLLAGARAVISNDSGPAHLAALLGTPTVTLFGPTSATVWRPRAARGVALTGNPAARPDDWGLDAGEVASAALAVSAADECSADAALS